MTTTAKHTVFAVAGIFAVVLLSGCAGSKNKLPMEAEVSEAYKKIYEACTPEGEFEAKKKELSEKYPIWKGFKPGDEFDLKPGEADSLSYEEAQRFLDKRTEKATEMQKKNKENSEKKEQEFNDWKEGKEQCPASRKNTADHFVSFKKTDGKKSGDEWEDITGESVQEYEMEGILTMFNSETGKNEDHKIRITFEKKESGWEGKSGLGFSKSSVIKIPR